MTTRAICERDYSSSLFLCGIDGNHSVPLVMHDKSAAFFFFLNFTLSAPQSSRVLGNQALARGRARKATRASTNDTLRYLIRHRSLPSLLLQITWVRRRDRQLLTVGTSTHSIDKRFVVRHSSTDWQLMIRTVTVEDAGIYECQVCLAGL